MKSVKCSTPMIRTNAHKPLDTIDRNIHFENYAADGYKVVASASVRIKKRKQTVPLICSLRKWDSWGRGWLYGTLSCLNNRFTVAFDQFLSNLLCSDGPLNTLVGNGSILSAPSFEFCPCPVVYATPMNEGHLRPTAHRTDV